MEAMTIGKLAKLAGVGVETVRFYQRKKILKVPVRTGAFRTYSNDDVQKIIFIKKAQELGFTLNEVKELLELNTKPRITCGEVKVKTLNKLNEVKEKISDLEKIKSSLEQLAYACDSSQDSIRQYKVQECFAFGLGCNC